MSSLLDILQKKAEQPAADKSAATFVPPESHMQTVELHLAVDNRNAQTPVSDLGIDFAAESPAVELQPDTHSVAQPIADPVAEPTGSPADKTQSLLVSQRRQRVKRNTSLLIGSLILILLAVTTAISILLQYTAGRDGEQSVVIPPEALQTEQSLPAVSAASQQPAVRPLRKEGTGEHNTDHDFARHH